LGLKKWQEAIDPLQTAVEQAPDDLLAKWNLRVAYLQSGLDPDSLDPTYRLSLTPGHPALHQAVKFTDIAAVAGVDLVNMGRASAWRDLNDDGWLDLATVGERSRNAMYLNNGNGTFTDVTSQAGIEARWLECPVDRLRQRRQPRSLYHSKRLVGSRLQQPLPQHGRWSF
jgi:hypothetical protein